MNSNLGESLISPDLRSEIDAVLDTLLADVQAVLGEQFVGLYLHGSLASGDFSPHRSDIDFLVVTDGELPEALLLTLEAMHARISSSCQDWARRLEGSYIPRQALRRYDPAHALHPALRVDGSFDVDHHAGDWVLQRHVLREHGVALAGPPLRELIDPVTPDQLRQAARGILQEWWQPMLGDPSRLNQAEYQVYAVLTMCRILYTLEHGEVVSKTAAAEWARAKLGAKTAGLIGEALAWGREMPFDHLEETLAFIRFTLDSSQPPGAMGG